VLTLSVVYTFWQRWYRDVLKIRGSRSSIVRGTNLRPTGDPSSNRIGPDVSVGRVNCCNWIVVIFPSRFRTPQIKSLCCRAALMHDRSPRPPQRRCPVTRVRPKIAPVLLWTAFHSPINGSSSTEKWGRKHKEKDLRNKDGYFYGPRYVQPSIRLGSVNE